jgi:hypothetical protein
MRYYEVSSSHMSPLSPSKEGAIRGAVRCPGCGGFPGKVGPVDITIQNRSGGRHGLNGVQGCSDLGVAKKKLLDSLDPVVASALLLGSVTTEEGRLLSDVVTYRIKDRIVVRGEKHASHRVCPECGAVCYFAMGRSYLYPEPDPRIVVFDSGLGGLVIRSDHFSRESMLKFPGVRVVDLEVLAEPLDGFGALEKVG